MTSKQPSDAPILEGAEYALLTDNDGVGYKFRFKTEGLTAHLKGDDAARFRSDHETIVSQYPDWKPDQILAQLWDQGGYSWLATEDGA